MKEKKKSKKKESKSHKTVKKASKSKKSKKKSSSFKLGRNQDDNLNEYEDDDMSKYSEDAHLWHYPEAENIAQQDTDYEDITERKSDETEKINLEVEDVAVKSGNT